MAVDPDDVFGFLRSNGYNAAAYDDGPRVFLEGYNNAPRQPPPLMYDLQSMTDDRDIASISGSHYTTNTAATTRSHATRSTKSKKPDSVFSRSSSYCTYGGASSVQSSVVPPLVAPHRSFVQQFNSDTATGSLPPAPNSHPSFELWCEFCELQNCNATFRGDDEAGWMQHHADHLGGVFPESFMCWFCDDHISFVAHKPAERREKFEDRMGHIRGHIFDEYKTREDMRPDFHVIEVMGQQHLLDEDTFRYAMHYTELPRPLRLPGDNPGARPLGRPAQQPQERGQYHDLEKERRHHRRHNRDPNARR
ncbi:hypothetical protein B0T17DRAFT_586643 [Bombardia bombarda]|uniref:Uncharacterized protein n=1 Tax=Bombardia bombarda TaxID=252184 RepID=A0AA40CE74_9PEZI|nr:hypothetical protein B0T17DRAFT_586643 [Bombardia bombarda]